MTENPTQTTQRPGAYAGQANLFDLQLLVRRCMGRIELAERLLASFESRFPQDLAKIEACLAADDQANLPRLVHQLKGAAANVSAPDLYTLLARLEQAVRDAETETTKQCLDDVHGVWDRYLQSKSLIEQR